MAAASICCIFAGLRFSKPEAKYRFLSLGQKIEMVAITDLSTIGRISSPRIAIAVSPKRWYSANLPATNKSSEGSRVSRPGTRVVAALPKWYCFHVIKNNIYSIVTFDRVIPRWLHSSEL
ncbi:hypothetical protein OHD62_32365 [Mesorhizobium sp. YC-39]|uniref:Uncharacterized protein n=1 Tax=Mesorhizobium robiniae TaxID=559315 RepID=A0ABV2GYZ7_9HYPH|nr:MULTISPECIES: hypothetical protein [unclassified Mesorhizobium]ANT54375.1 hypothetical protein A6B35_30475 [Mesorhizobium amorphae CCNWGS0123]MCV3211353.1 hypothetical protein [Mesorhizobium sp. YC-2]MCV3233078.1 hypothetical protein [Mesorhizobium sp. YC-39]